MMEIFFFQPIDYSENACIFTEILEIGYGYECRIHLFMK